MESQERNHGRKVYSLGTGTALPEWLGERARRNLAKRDASVRHRVELLQDFAMPSASNRIRQSADGRHVMVVGTYPPRLRCYDLAELSMKFERYVDSEPLDLCLLGHDFGKLVVLGSDRTLEFHAAYGRHDTVRIPTPGRAVAYEPSTCDLLVAGSSDSSIYRFNLDEGRFREPLRISGSRRRRRGGGGGLTEEEEQDSSSNCIQVSPTHALHAVGGNDGVVRFYDGRLSSNTLGPTVTLDVHTPLSQNFITTTTNNNNNTRTEVTSLAFDHSGMQFAAGTSHGCVALYDMRSSKPLYVKEHQYGLPIHTVQFHKSTSHVLSSDSKLIKVWSTGRGSSSSSRLQMGDIVTNVEGTGGLTHFIVSGDEQDPQGHDSGLILCSSNQPKMEAFYCPVLGNAPRWCSFLDNITEELEEKTQTNQTTIDASGGTITTTTETTFQDYKFVTRDEVEELQIDNLIGTDLLRGYMHGFFIHASLYNRVRAVVKPFEYEEYRKKKIQQKLQQSHGSRITPRHDTSTKLNVNVNPKLALELERKAARKDQKAANVVVAKKLLVDDRFKELFQNPDYQIDEEDIQFKLRNPSGRAKVNPKDEDMDSDAGDQDNNDDDDDGHSADEKYNDTWRKHNDDSDHTDTGSESDRDDDTATSDEDDEVALAKVRGEKYDEMKILEEPKTKLSKTTTKKRNNNNNKNHQQLLPRKDDSVSMPLTNKKKPRLYEAEELDDEKNLVLRVGLGNSDDKPEEIIRKKQLLIPLEDRMKDTVEANKEKGAMEMRKIWSQKDGMVRELRYVPPKTSKKKEEQGNTNKRRSAKSLKLNR